MSFKLLASLGVFFLALLLRGFYAYFIFSANVAGADGAHTPAYLIQGGDSPTYVVPAYYLYEKGAFCYSSEMAARIGIDDKPNTVNFGKDPTGKNPQWGFIYNHETSYTRRLPAYSCLLMIIPAFPSYASGVAAVILLQCVLDSVTALFIFWIAALLLGKYSVLSFIPAFFYAINFSAVVCCARLLTDTFFAFLFAFSVLLFLNYLKAAYTKEAVKWLLTALLVSSVALLTRPVGLVLFGAMGLVLGLRGLYCAYAAKNLKPLVWDFSAGLAVACVFTILAGSWSYRNFKQNGEFSFEPTYAVNRAFYVAVPYIAKEKKMSLVDAQYMVYADCVKSAEARGIDLTQTPLNQYPSILNSVADGFLKNAGWSYSLKSNFISGPFFIFYPDYGLLNVVGACNTNIPTPNKIDVLGFLCDTTGFFANQIFSMPILWILAFFIYLSSLFFAVLGIPLLILLMALRKIKLSVPVIFLCVIVFVQLFSVGVAASARYSLPIIPYFFILSALAFACLFDAASKYRKTLLGKISEKHARHKERWYVQIVKYFFVSCVAALVDFAAFMGVHYFTGTVVVSNVAGFILGLITNYALSVVWIFGTRKYKKRIELPVFALTGLVGLGISTAVVWFFADKLGYAPSISKIISIGATFFWNFGMRKMLLFTAKKRPPIKTDILTS